MSDTEDAGPEAERPEPVVLAPVYKRTYNKRKGRRRVPIERAPQNRPAKAAAETPTDTARQENVVSPDDGPVTRRSRSERTEGMLAIPRSRFRPGWDFEWKVITVVNQPVPPADMMAVHDGGWRPERAKDWPEYVLPGSSPDGPVEQYGQRLYGRPMALTLEARQEDYSAAVEQQTQRMQAATTGHLSRRGEQGEGLADLGRVVRPTGASLSIEGEVGVHGVRR
jgi:hypothetical protein